MGREPLQGLRMRARRGDWPEPANSNLVKATTAARPGGSGWPRFTRPRRRRCDGWRMFRITTLLVLLACLPPASALACSCVPPGTPEQEASRAAHVFIGDVASMRVVTPSVSWWTRLLIRLGLEEPPHQDEPPEYAVAFRNVDAFKAARRGRFTVLTSDSGGLCGVPFRVGQRYVVYADEHRDGPRASICSRTALARDAQADLDWLQAHRGRIP